MYHEHVFALVKTVDGANLDAIHVFAFDAIFDNDVGHQFLRAQAESARSLRFLMFASAFIAGMQAARSLAEFRRDSGRLSRLIIEVIR
jgi:hypothetical protein